MIALAFVLMGWLAPHPDLGRQLAAARDSLAKCSQHQKAPAEARGATAAPSRLGRQHGPLNGPQRIARQGSAKHHESRGASPVVRTSGGGRDTFTVAGRMDTTRRYNVATGRESYPEKVARGITSPKVAESLAAHETGHTPPSGIPSSSGIVAAHGSLPAVLGSFPSAVPPPSGFTLPQGSQQEVMPNEPALRSAAGYDCRADVLTGAAHRANAGYFTRHPGVACLTKAAAAFGVGYLIGSFNEHHDTRTVFVAGPPRHDGDGDDDDDHHGRHGHRKDCKR